MAVTIDLSDKHILLTGASRGIGKAIAQLLIQAGARVAIHYRKSEGAAKDLVAVLGERATAFQADLSQPEQVTALFESVKKSFGRIDVLINNAGIALPSPMDAEEAQWLEQWNKTMAVNLTAAAQLSRHCLEHMLAQGGGRLIHIASRAADRGDTPEYMAYAASKAGMLAMHKTIARFYGKQGIHSFAIAPGFTRTDMAQQFIDKYVWRALGAGRHRTFTANRA
jgi:NAD(P)-dependent dehydrogenase (short-subunit alcohol dehydrogenase family)